jgi:hypothetical protein
VKLTISVTEVKNEWRCVSTYAVMSWSVLIYTAVCVRLPVTVILMVEPVVL